MTLSRGEPPWAPTVSTVGAGHGGANAAGLGGSQQASVCRGADGECSHPSARPSAVPTACLSLHREAARISRKETSIRAQPHRLNRVAAGSLTAPRASVPPCAAGMLTAASEPGVSGLRGRAGRWAPGTNQARARRPPHRLMGGQPRLPTGTWREAPHLGGGAPGRGGATFRPCQVPPTGCSPQRGPRGLFPAPPPAPRQAFQAPQSSRSGLGPGSCGSLALCDRKDMLRPHVQRPTCARRLESKITGHPLPARHCTPTYHSPPSDPHEGLEGRVVRLVSPSLIQQPFPEHPLHAGPGRGGGPAHAELML